MIRNILCVTFFFIINTCSFAQWNPIPDGHCFTPGGGVYFPYPPIHSVSNNGVIFRSEFYEVSASIGHAYDICRSTDDFASSNLFVFESSPGIGSSCCKVSKIMAIDDTTLSYAKRNNPGPNIMRKSLNTLAAVKLSLYDTTFSFYETKQNTYAVTVHNNQYVFFASNINNISFSDTINYNNIAVSGIPQVVFKNDSIGYVIAKDTLNKNILIRTSDYGHSWSLVLLSTNALKDLSFFGDTAIAVGKSGEIYRSITNGLTWNTLPHFTTNNLNSVSIGSSSICYAAGDNATLFKSLDFGNTWIQETLSISSNIDWVKVTNTNAVYFQSQNKVYKENYFALVKELKNVARSLIVYPNPTSGSITIQTDEKVGHKFSVFIVNSIGEVLLESDKTTIDLNSISSGLYSVELKTSDGEVFRSKVVKID